MKEIVVQWTKCNERNNPFYENEMIVEKSNHPRFTKGSRFDFGFFYIATSEGYTIISKPPSNVHRSKYGN